MGGELWYGDKVLIGCLVFLGDSHGRVASIERGGGGQSGESPRPFATSYEERTPPRGLLSDLLLIRP